MEYLNLNAWESDIQSFAFLQQGQIKTGAPCRSERLAKYNQVSYSVDFNLFWSATFISFLQCFMLNISFLLHFESSITLYRLPHSSQILGSTIFFVSFLFLGGFYACFSALNFCSFVLQNTKCGRLKQFPLRYWFY